MNSVDIGIVVILILSLLGGLWRGFILQVASILGALAAFGIARLEYQDVSRSLQHIMPHSSWLPIVSYLAVFLVVWIAIILIARRIRSMAHLLFLAWADRLGGAVIGVVQGLLLVELLLYLGRRSPATELKHLINQAVLTPTFVQLFPYLHRLFPHLP